MESSNQGIDINIDINLDDLDSKQGIYDKSNRTGQLEKSFTHQISLFYNHIKFGV